MDPITVIVSALAAGAAAALKDTASRVVKDSYSILKSLVQRKFPGAKIDLLEEEPGSSDYQAVIRKNLKDASDDPDTELLEKAKELIEAINQKDSSILQTVGVDLEDIRAVSINIEGVRSSGTGVSAKKVTADGDISIKNIDAGGGRSDPKV